MGPELNPKKLIRDLYENNGPLNANKERDTATIRDLIVRSFSSSACFVSELLQNADDCQKADDCFVPSASFSLHGNELIFYHHGRLFDDKDVRKICNYNVPKNDKSENSEQTGHKDIGFKSVFNIASRVDICSGVWRFHFDENHEDWKDSPQERPWQILPLWTDETKLSNLAKTIIQEIGRTTFIFKLRDNEVEKVQNALNEYQPENMLFLRNIRKIRIQTDAKDRDMLAQEKPDNHWIIQENKEFKSQWTTIDKKIEKNKEMIAFLKQHRSDPFLCPSRLQKKEPITVSLAYQMSNDGQYKKTEGGKLFCTLPIEQSGLPFHVNAPFLTIPSREHLIEKKWNEIILQLVAELHFEHIKDFFAKKIFSALNVLAGDTLFSTDKDQSATNESYISKSFNSIFKKLIASEAFIPSLTGKAFLKLDDCTLDYFGFYRQLHNEHGIRLDIMDKIIHHGIDSNKFKKRFNAKQLQIADVIGCLPSSKSVGLLKVNLELSEMIIAFFSKHFSTQSSFSPEDLNSLKTRQFIWTQSKKNVSLISHPLLNSGQLELPDSLPLSIDFVHNDLIKTAGINWLKDHGVKDLDFISLIDRIKFNLNDNTFKDIQKNIRFIQFVFDFYRLSSSEQQKALRKLKGLLLISDTGQCKKSEHLYLSEKFKPSMLNKDIPYNSKSAFFINEAYLRQGDNPKEWTEFFLALGVNQDYDFITGISYISDIENIPEAFMKEYRENIESPLVSKVKGEHRMTPFIASPYIVLLASTNDVLKNNFSLLFWQCLKQYQEEILKNYSSTTCVAPSKKQPQEFTYFQYVFRNKSLITHGNTLRKTGQLYATSIFKHLSKTFKSKSSNDVLEKYVIKRIAQKVVALPVTLLPKMEKFLGFQTMLALNDCVEQLKELQKNYNLNVYKWVLRNILKNIKAREGSQTPLKADQLKIQLEANDGSWQDPSDLQMWAVPHSDGAPNGSFWIKDVLDDEEMHQLCDFFDIDPLETCLNVDPDLQAPHFEVEIRKNIPALAYFLAKFNRNTPKEALKLILPKFDQLKFFQVSEEDLGAPIGRKDNHIYIVELEGNYSTIYEEIGKFLKLDEQEIKAITRPFRRQFTKELEKHFIPFQELYEEYLKDPFDPSWHEEDEDTALIFEKPSQKSPIEQQPKINSNHVNVPNMPSVTPPTTPVKTTTSSTTTATPKSKPPVLEWQPEISPENVPLSIPGQMCPNSPPPKLPKLESVTSTPSKQQKEGKDFDINGSEGEGLSEPVGIGNLTNQNEPPENSPQEPTEADKINDKLRKENNQKVGKWGEEVVFRTVVFEYETKGYKEQPSPQPWLRKLCYQNDSTIEIEWMNHPERLIAIPSKFKNDSGKPYDIRVVEIENKIPTNKFIEVKSTTIEDNHFSLSANEIGKFFKKKDKYCIYNVINSGKEKLTIEKCSYQDFLNYISDGRLKPYQGEVKFKGKRPKPSQENAHAEGQ